MKISRKSEYTRPELEVIPCRIPAIMEPSIHALGSNWADGGTENLGFGTYNRPTSLTNGSFRFKSVWDATAKELQNGELVEVPIE